MDPTKRGHAPVVVAPHSAGSSMSAGRAWAAALSPGSAGQLGEHQPAEVSTLWVSKITSYSNL